MGIEVLLNFNAEGACTSLQERFASIVNELCQTVLANAQANLGGRYEEVASSLQTRLMNLAEQGIIEGSVSTDHWEAWIAEWGSGSSMDTSNPALQEYRSSEYWNPERTDLEITGRPTGSYLGLDGQMHQSSGKLAGVNLEELAAHDAHFQQWMASMGMPFDAFMPRPQLHFMRNALLSNKNLILDQLNAVIETFNFGDFFV